MTFKQQLEWLRYWYEKIYPLLISSLLTVLAGKFKIFGDNTSEITNQLADNSLSIAVTLLGFFLTILTIINGIDTRRMRFVKELGGFGRLMNYLKLSILFNLILIGAAFIVKYIEHRTTGNSYLFIYGCNILDYTFIFLFLWTLLISFRFTKAFVSLMTDPAN